MSIYVFVVIYNIMQKNNNLQIWTIFAVALYWENLS